MRSETSGAELHPENYRFLRQHVYSQSGIVIDQDKHYLFESRLTPLVRQLGLDSINDLCGLLRATQETGLGRRVVEAMTTNETYFFRTPLHYEAIRTVLLPQLREDRRVTRKLRFWSASVSTGQEAYSLAMVLIEAGLSHWDVQIVGTDFSTEVLERARSGKYRQIEVSRGLPATLLVKYFRRSGLDWQLSEHVLRMVRFETIDLRQSLRALGPFDLVFCRNVMMYFDTATREKILKELHGTLVRGGWLLLGAAETAEVEERFERQTIGGATLYVAR